MGSGGVAEAVQAFGAAVDALLDADVSGVDPAVMAVFERQVRRLPAVSFAMIAALQSSTTPRELEPPRPVM